MKELSRTEKLQIKTFLKIFFKPVAIIGGIFSALAVMIGTVIGIADCATGASTVISAMYLFTHISMAIAIFAALVGIFCGIRVWIHSAWSAAKDKLDNQDKQYSRGR